MKTLMGFVTGGVVGTIVGLVGFACLLIASADIEDKVWIIDGSGHQYIKREDFNDRIVEQ